MIGCTKDMPHQKWCGISCKNQLAKGAALVELVAVSTLWFIGLTVIASRRHSNIRECEWQVLWYVSLWKLHLSWGWATSDTRNACSPLRLCTWIRFREWIQWQADKITSLRGSILVRYQPVDLSWKVTIGWVTDRLLWQQKMYTLFLLERFRFWCQWN